jgi:hypothetical protein
MHVFSSLGIEEHNLRLRDLMRFITGSSYPHLVFQEQLRSSLFMVVQMVVSVVPLYLHVSWC